MNDRRFAQSMQRVKALREEHGGTLPSRAHRGEYPVFYLGSDAADLCANCAQKEIDTVVGFYVNWSWSSLTCDRCSKPIECVDEPEEETR